MKIFIDNVIENNENKGELYIESDSMQFSVNIYNGKKDAKGNELYANKGYFTSLTSALKHVVRMKIHASTASTIHELLNEIKGYEAYLQEKIAI